MRELEMSPEELLKLPVSVDLVTAGRAFGVGRTKAFELARAGKFPVRVITVGNKYRVPRSAIFEALGVADQSAAAQLPKSKRSTPRRVTRRARARAGDADNLPAA